MVGPISGSMSGIARIAGICVTALMIACATSQSPDDGDGQDAMAGAIQELSSVDVQREGEETVITFAGLENPAFSDYRLEDANLLVIELEGVTQGSDSLFGAVSGGEKHIEVYDGLVDQVSTATFQGDEGPMTRVEVSFAQTADYQLIPASNGLSLYVRPGVAAADSMDEPDAMAEADDDASGEIAMADDEGMASDSAEDPWAEAPEIETAPEAAAEASSSVEMPEVLPNPEPATVVRSIETTATDQGVLFHVGADGMIGSAETFVLDGPDRLVIDLPGIKNEISSKTVEVGGSQVARVRIGSHPDKVRFVLDGAEQSAGFVGRRVVPAADGLFVTVGAGVDLDEALSAGLATANAALALASNPPMSDESPSAWGEEGAAPASPASWQENTTSAATAPIQGANEGGGIAPLSDEKPDGLSEVYGLQYDRNDDRDRIAVLSDQVVDYELLTPDPDTVVVNVHNAVISRQAAERITPTAGGPVSLVTTFQLPDVPGYEVRVVVKRAPNLEPQIMRRGSLLFLDFENTGVAAAPPPAFIEGEPPRHQESYANAIEMSDQSGGESMAMGTGSAADGEMLSKAAAMAGAPMEPQSVSSLPQFDESTSMAAPLDNEEWTAAPSQALASPASLEPPAAVEILEEGGLIDGKEYQGRRISLDFKDVAMADVLRLIADVSDLNLIAGDEVKGTITIRLVDVPWDQALDVILLTKGLGFVRVGNVLRIAPAEILQVEEEVRMQERRNMEKLEDLEVKLQPVNYADVGDAADLVKRLLSPRGTVNEDERTNTLIIKDISSVIDEATALIQAIDTQTPQVMIEAKIVEANLEFSRELGSAWGVGTQRFTDGFNPNTPRTDLGNGDFKFQGENSVVFGNPITSTATGLLSFGAFLLDEKMQVNVSIAAMEASGDGKVISSPRIVTLDNREAEIQQGVSIPFQTFEGGDAKLEFIDAVLSLRVTPHITSDQSIIMALEITRNAPDASVSTPTGSPAIAKNQAKTETLIKDGQTLVIGGIYTVDKTERQTRVPYLHRIPVLGAAFRSKEISDIRKELLIFVTPRVVVNPALAIN